MKDNGSSFDEKTLSALDNKIMGFNASKDPVLFSAVRVISIRLADKATDLAAGASVGGDFRIPFACTVVGVGAYVDTAGTQPTTIDINEAGTSILSTKLTIDANEKSSETAAAAVVSDASLAADAILTIDLDTVTATVPKGLTVWLKVIIS